MSASLRARARSVGRAFQGTRRYPHQDIVARVHARLLAGGDGTLVFSVHLRVNLSLTVAARGLGRTDPNADERDYRCHRDLRPDLEA